MTLFRKVSQQRGFALIVVLWVLTLLGVIAAALLRDSGTETKVAYNLRENAKAEALAEAGVQRAILGLLDSDDASVWRADRTPYTFSLADGVAIIRLQSEAGKIDVNSASDELITGLFVAVGMSEGKATELVAAMADFRDSDSIRHAGGAEDADYEAVDAILGSKDAPFERVEELMQVRGITPEMYERISAAVTVYGRGQLDVTTAPDLVLQVLRNVMPERLNRMIAARQASAVKLSRPRTVTVTVEVHTSGGGRFLREAIIQRTAGPEPYRVLAWRQRWSAPASAH